ncbi:hypothetical protein [Methylophaga sp. OBS4]|uniref:hypothetical protein n=1 Tax=Methylophaga sp. OBS4 TaxID=2991935 RepID=UPI00225134AB|nr:hypothetical protein [Methylophaga sp. OBS4]MCX4187609.1 hypothetical protein [Methylophaga sp. OBS4]
MVLLAIKRTRNLPLSEIQERYRNHSLGVKLNGLSACRKAGEHCRNYDSEPGLRELVKGGEALEKLCDRIEELTMRRNSLLHGLITKVKEESTSVVINQSLKKTFELTEKVLMDIKDDVIQAIEDLNELIPVPGVIACYASGPDLDLHYDELALNTEDPLVSLVENLRNN